MSEKPETVPKKRGRRSIRTDEVAARLAEFIARGLPLRHACELAGISVSSFCDWRNNSAKLREQIALALAHCVDARLKKIESANCWRSAAWLLAVSDREHFGAKRDDLNVVVHTEPEALPISDARMIELLKKFSTNEEP